MKIFATSDLHENNIEKLLKDYNDILILAEDIGNPFGVYYSNLIKKVSKKSCSNNNNWES